MTKADSRDEILALAERLGAMVSANGKAIVCNGRTTFAMCEDITQAAAALRAHAAKENDDAS